MQRTDKWDNFTYPEAIKLKAYITVFLQKLNQYHFNGTLVSLISANSSVQVGTLTTH